MAHTHSGIIPVHFTEHRIRTAASHQTVAIRLRPYGRVGSLKWMVTLKCTCTFPHFQSLASQWLYRAIIGMQITFCKSILSFCTHTQSRSIHSVAFSTATISISHLNLLMPQLYFAARLTQFQNNDY